MHAGPLPAGRLGRKALAIITGQVGASVSAQHLGISLEVPDAVRAPLRVGAAWATLNASIDDVCDGAKAIFAASS